MKEAKAELLKLKNSNTSAKDNNITLEGAYQLWLIRAENQNFSPKSVKILMHI